ncbi:SIMPL domain-containing protein [Brassicibacter mesophilus]|uniref:SIMPL domain-containing protein n=1 Tax=Brassicibacter mesophilus TaxID=745119 RepID=UPI003D2294AC
MEQIYDYIDGKRVLRGYRVTNKFVIVVEDIKKIGTIIDTAVENGTNTVYNVEFQISNQSAYYREALTKAVENAIEKACDIGIILRTNINSIPIKIVEEHYESYSPRQQVFRAPETETPIIVGEVEISAKIIAIFTY